MILARPIRAKILALSLLVAAARAQPVSFDVASVQPNTFDDRIVTIVTIDSGPGGRLNARGYTLKLLIQQAYDIKGFQISGGPGWLDTDRYDITARGRRDATPGELRLMLQALLEERFALKVHNVQRETAGFELSATGAHPGLTPSSAKVENTQMARDAKGALAASGLSMTAFGKIVGAYVAKPIVDKTGLPGLYDFSILWTEHADQVPDADSTGVPLISALRDQLGLRLTPKRVSVGMIVIDSAAKPTPN